MSEIQITRLQVNEEDLSGYDTGGATREVNVSIMVDSSLPKERQRECLIHEVLGAYLGSVLSVDMLSLIASDINEAIIGWENL